MTKILIIAAGLGLGMSSAGACEYMRSVQTTVDQTVVASIETKDAASTEKDAMSTPWILPDATDRTPVIPQ